MQHVALTISMGMHSRPVMTNNEVSVDVLLSSCCRTYGLLLQETSLPGETVMGSCPGEHCGRQGKPSSTSISIEQTQSTMALWPSVQVGASELDIRRAVGNDIQDPLRR